MPMPGMPLPPVLPCSRGARTIWLILGALALLATSAVGLERPRPGELQQLRERKQLSTSQGFARSLGNHRVDTYRLRRAITSLRRQVLSKEGRTAEEIDRLAPQPAPPPAWVGMPTRGAVRIFALLIDFNDYPHTNAQATVHQSLFGPPNPTAEPFDSLAAWYSRASYQQLDLSGGATLGWYRYSGNRSAIEQSPSSRQSLIRQAIQSVDAGHDFSVYDNDNDGCVDYFMVFWAGPPGDWATFWWGYQTSWSDPTYQVDGKRLGDYSWQWESSPTGAPFSPVVAIHETGHALGLPDYYDYDDSVGPDGGVGDLDMMDANRHTHCGFSRWLLDWMTPTVGAMPALVGDGPQTLTLQPAASSPASAVVVWPGIGSDGIFGEYFLVENRQRVGNDRSLPTDGLVIWHLDARLDGTGNDFVYDNSWTDHKLMKLVEADGGNDIENGGSAYFGDFYTAGSAFGPATTPSSQKYDGTPSGVSVGQITALGTSSGSPWSALFSAVASNQTLELTVHRQGKDRLGKGKTWNVDVLVKVNGAPAGGGQTVHLKTTDPRLAKVSVAQAQTAANGVATAVLTGMTRKRDQTLLTAESDGAAKTEVIKVPAVSPWGAAILSALLGILAATRRRSSR